MQAKITGLREFRSKLANIRGNIAEGIDAELEAAAENIELNAKMNVTDSVKLAGGKSLDVAGQLRNSFYLESSPLRKEVGVRNITINGRFIPLGAYQEFGTGVYIDIPPGLEDYAMTFYVNGRGRILPSPFLFPAVERERVEIIKRIKALLGG